MNGYFTLPKAPEFEPHHQMYFCVISVHMLRVFYLSAEVQSAYSIAPTESKNMCLGLRVSYCVHFQSADRFVCLVISLNGTTHPIICLRRVSDQDYRSLAYRNHQSISRRMRPHN